MAGQPQAGPSTCVPGSWDGPWDGAGRTHGSLACPTTPSQGPRPRVPGPGLRALTAFSFVSLRWEGLVLIVLYGFYILIMK